MNQGTKAGCDGPGDALVLPFSLLAQLRNDLESSYPREGCGVLVGDVEVGRRRVTRLEPAANHWSVRADRYLVDPDTVRRLMQDEEEGGPRVLGFYHSHPDAEPIPSPTDQKYAWPWYHYLIVAVDRGKAGIGRVWELENGAFTERYLTTTHMDPSHTVHY